MAELDDITLAMLALGPGMALPNSGLPLHECIALCEDPKIIERGEEILLRTVARLASGAPVDPQLRDLVYLWSQQLIHKHPRWYKHKRSGRPNNAKAAAVAWAYAQKIEKNPKVKREAIIGELEQEFGLKRRRILKMIEEIDHRNRH
jgi:hypothetical protein